MWANMKMWIWASSCMRGTDGTKCGEALRNSSRGSESRKQWCTECLLVEVLALCRIPKSPSWGLGSQKGGVKHGKTVGVEYLLYLICFLGLHLKQFQTALGNGYSTFSNQWLEPKKDDSDFPGNCRLDWNFKTWAPDFLRWGRMGQIAQGTIPQSQFGKVMMGQKK